LAYLETNIMLLQKISAGYSAPISKFKNNPAAYIAEANGDAVAVMSHNEVGFYAVPADLFEELLAFAEYAQRGTSKLVNLPARLTLSEGQSLDQVAEGVTTAIKNASEDDYSEC